MKRQSCWRVGQVEGRKYQMSGDSKSPRNLGAEERHTYPANPPAFLPCILLRSGTPANTDCLRPAATWEAMGNAEHEASTSGKRALPCQNKAAVRQIIAPGLMTLLAQGQPAYGVEKGKRAGLRYRSRSHVQSSRAPYRKYLRQSSQGISMSAEGIGRSYPGHGKTDCLPLPSPPPVDSRPGCHKNVGRT